VTGDAQIDLLAYANSGKTLLIIEEWNDTIFDEYLLVCFYTPEGLYETDEIFSIPGVIIYHIDARIGDGFDEDSAYYTIFNYNNTDTAHKMIKIIEADMDNDISRTGYSEDTDLFQTGKELGGNVYPNYAWYQSTLNPMDFTIEVGAMTSSQVTIYITFE